MAKAKKGKSGKLPKMVAGVELPKELRKQGAKLLDLVKNPLVADLVAAGLVALAANVRNSGHTSDAKEKGKDKPSTAEELGKTADYHAAFAAYERRVRPFVLDKQRKARRFAKTFVPSSRLGVQLSYLTMKLMFTPLLAHFIGKQFGFDSLLQAAR